MFPKEHGAYGQLLFPLATALAIGRPSAAASLLAAAAIAAFLAHEPLLVILGQRGARAARDQRARAWRWLAGMGSLAVVLGAAAVVALPASARTALLLPAALAVVLGGVVSIGREHTTGGEIAAALTMASLALPVGIASGASAAAALTCVVAYAAAFLVATLCVRALILVTRKLAGPSTRVVAGGVAVALVVALFALARAGITRPIGTWAALPICAVGVWLVAAMPSPRHLRTIGWTLVGATTLTAIVLIVGLRIAAPQP
ncbi:MAG TPA: YwiC-like family protein [Rhodanobacteraceae bacterium]